MQRRSRVYLGSWKHKGAARGVVVKVVSRRQAAHEARVLKAVSVRPEARAIQVLAQIPVNGLNDDVGLVTPYCSGGHLFEGAASVHDVLRQAVQLCEVRWQLLVSLLLLCRSRCCWSMVVAGCCCRRCSCWCWWCRWCS